jgi:LCP family protein required for cell wall assembly
MEKPMKTSLIAFIIMIVIIFFAGNIPEQMSSPEANISGRKDNIVLAAPWETPTPPHGQVLVPPSEQSSPADADQVIRPTADRVDPTTFDAEIAATSIEAIQPISNQEASVAPDAGAQTTFGESIRNTVEQAIHNTFDQEKSATPRTSIRARSGQSIWNVINQKSTPTTHIIYLSSIARAIPPTPEPLPPEIHFTDDEGRSWSDYSGPSIWPDLQAPAPAGILSHPEDQINILLLGSDKRPNDSGFRTDTIQLLTVNPSAGSVKLTSFPRDLYVNIPGYTVQRINTAWGWGGFEALADTMEYNFGVRPEYYVLINFDAFLDGIDSLGGVVVDVGRDFCDHRDAFGQFCISQSNYWMNGKTALWYVRSRYTTSDLDRGRRQQEVLEAIFKRLVSINGLSRVPELYDIYKKNVETNIDFNLISNLLPVALRQAESRDINNYSIGRGQVYDWINYSGAMVLVPVRESVLEVMREVISEP